eukprot:513111_1
MKHLWLDKFQYQHISIATDVIIQEKENYITVEQLNDFLNTIRSLIQSKQYEGLPVDGLILIYSGHGNRSDSDNLIVCSDNMALSITAIQEKFSAANLNPLSNKPKIFYFDCCRGNTKIKEENIFSKPKGDGTTYLNKLSDFIIHYATCQDYRSWTKNQKDGSYFINALYNCYKNNLENHEHNRIALHDTSVKINELVAEDIEGKQTAEIIDRLTYDVYVQPYKGAYKNDKPISRIGLHAKINKLQLKLKFNSKPSCYDGEELMTYFVQVLEITKEEFRVRLDISPNNITHERKRYYIKDINTKKELHEISINPNASFGNCLLSYQQDDEYQIYHIGLYTNDNQFLKNCNTLTFTKYPLNINKETYKPKPVNLLTVMKIRDTQNEKVLLYWDIPENTFGKIRYCIIQDKFMDCTDSNDDELKYETDKLKYETDKLKYETDKLKYETSIDRLPYSISLSSIPIKIQIITISIFDSVEYKSDATYPIPIGTDGTQSALTVRKENKDLQIKIYSLEEKLQQLNSIDAHINDKEHTQPLLLQEAKWQSDIQNFHVSQTAVEQQGCCGNLSVAIKTILGWYDILWIGANIRYVMQRTFDNFYKRHQQELQLQVQQISNGL